MPDYYGWRSTIGVATSSINTCIQPEFDAMRPMGVSNQVARMHIPSKTMKSDKDFAHNMDVHMESLGPAIDSLMTLKPDHLIMTISSMAVWGGSSNSADDLKQSVVKRAGREIGVTMPSDGLVAALKALEVKRIAILDPYYPVIQPSLESFFGEFGFEVVRFVHMRGEQLTELSRVSSTVLVDALKSIDGPDIEAVVQFGANWPIAAIADEAERWIGKPLVATNIATYWHALRSMGITDRVEGYSRLMREL
ncbi:MAG TPA: hypothetical protein VGM83_03670 [Devosiaceae bacterium]